MLLFIGNYTVKEGNQRALNRSPEKKVKGHSGTHLQRTNR